jgi:hypothetical protein
MYSVLDLMFHKACQGPVTKTHLTSYEIHDPINPQ